MDFVKNNILNLVVIGLMLWLIVWGKPSAAGTSSGPDTVYTSHTEYVPQPTQYVPQYQPIIVESKIPQNIPPQYQPPKDTAELKDFILFIVKKLLAENRYRDSTVLVDSAGNRVGVFRNDDLVSENAIKSRAPSYTLTLPHTIETRTISLPADNRRKLFIGPELTGNQFQLLRKASIGALWLDRRDRVYRASIGYDMVAGQQVYEVARYFKIGK